MKCKKLITAALIICMVLSSTSVAYAAGGANTDPVRMGLTSQTEYYAELPEARDPEAEDSLQEHMDYFVNHIGQRLAGTPNEDKAAAYIKDQFEAIGYTDVEWAKPSRTSITTGRVVFSDGAGDIHGNPLPNSDAFGAVTGKLVDLGTFPDLAVPEGVTGKVVGAVRFDGTPNINNLNPVLTALVEENDIELTGVMLANTTTYTVSFVSGAPVVPCITTTNYFLDRALARAESFDHMERYTNATTNAVIATKPAPGGDPDMIIVVSSHMDCVLPSPGASDNASGAATTLELAKRLYDTDLGNIEVRFAVCGSEESGGMAGSVYVADSLVEEGKAAISINLNMDMICSPGTTRDGRTLNAVSMDINPNPLAFNLPAYLVTDDAKDIDWADGIDNVRIYRYGSSDHVSFDRRGVEAGSMIIATDTDDDIEVQNHNSRDNLLENYSYERHLMCTNLMENAVLKAASQEISKRAKFYVSEKSGTVTLVNAEQLFKTYDTVSGTFSSAGGDIPFTFTPGKTVVGLADAQDYTITGVTAMGNGNADNNNAERNEQYKSFSTALVAQEAEIDALTLSTKAHLVKAGDSVTLNAAFDKVISSNTAILTYAFDGSLFEYVGFTPADGVTVINEESGDGSAKITIMRPGYDLEAFGEIELLAKADADLADGRQQVGLDLEYVVKGEADEKEIKTIGAHVFFVTADKDRIPGDTNDDGKVDLIDLSNMVDWFGTRSTNPDWDTQYIFFDFNNNSQIDVYDISYVARLIA